MGNYSGNYSNIDLNWHTAMDLVAPYQREPQRQTDLLDGLLDAMQDPTRSCSEERLCRSIKEWKDTSSLLFLWYLTGQASSKESWLGRHATSETAKEFRTELSYRLQAMGQACEDRLSDLGLLDDVQLG